MINQQYIDLMNQELDGANTPEQSRELEEYLKGHDEAQAYYRELTLAVNVFEKVTMLDPPPTLGDEIMGALDRQDTVPDRAAPDEPRRPWAAGLAWLRPSPAYAFTFLAGLVFGLVLYAGSGYLTGDGDLGPNGHLSATAGHRADDLAAVQESRLDEPGLAGRIRTGWEDGDLRLKLDLTAEQPTVIRIDHTGQGTYDLVLRRSATDDKPIEMSIYSEGRLVHRESLSAQEK